MPVLNVAMKHVREQGVDRWVPCFDDEEVLNTPGESLIFLEVAPDAMNLDASASDRNSISQRTWSKIIAAAEDEFQRRLPSPDTKHHMKTFCVNTDYEKAGKRTEYSYNYKCVLTAIVRVKNPYYDGDDPDEALEVVSQTGQCRVVEPNKWRMGGRTRSYGDHNYAEELYEEDCRCVKDKETGDWVIVRDKKWARMLDRRRAKADQRLKERGGRTTSYLKVHEFGPVIAALASHVRRQVGVVDWKDFELASRPDRSNAVSTFLFVLEHFNLVFGLNAHRQVSEWWDFIKMWKAHGEATRRVWGRIYCYRSSAGSERLWDWLDEEAKAKRPPKACLDRRVDERLVGLPGHLNEEGYMRKYQPEKWERLHGEKEKQLEEEEGGEAEDADAASAA